MARANDIETSDLVRKSAYSFEIHNNVLRIFPNPTSNDNGEKIYFEVGLTAHSANCEKVLFGEQISVDNYEGKNYVYFRITSRNNAPVIKEFIESDLSNNSNFSEYINGSKRKPNFAKFIEFKEITLENIEKVVIDEMENAKSFLEQIFLSVE